MAQNTQSQQIGITAPVPMGDWQASTTYLKLNIVRYNGASYIAKKQSTGVEPTVTTGWQEVWQVVNYDGLVTPVGNYPDMTVGKAIQAENDGTGANIADKFSAIDEVIPATASADNQLADKAFVNSSINNMAAFYITYNADGSAFPTRADLLNATTFYNGGEIRVPTQNDYAIVLADESQAVGVDGSYPTTRYSYQGGTYPDGQWDFQYVVNNTSLTQAQVDALNSGITKELVDSLGDGVVTPTGTYPEMTVGKATNAINAENAIVAEQVGEDTVGSSTIPIYLADGKPTECSRIPSITLNGRTAVGDIYAPSSGGDVGGLILRSNGAGLAPTWAPCTQYSSAAPTVRDNADYVTDYYRSPTGASWYRVWASGWKECGGYATLASSPQNIIFLRSFSDANYTVTLTVVGAALSGAYNNTVQVSSKTGSTMTVIKAFSETDRVVCYMAEGY